MSQAMSPKASSPAQDFFIEFADDVLPFLPTLRAVGVGSAGVRILDGLIARGIAGIETLAVGTSRRALAASAATTRLEVGRALLGGRGPGGDAALAASAARGELGAVREALTDADLVFVVAGLGGGTGSGVAPLVAEAARAAGALTVAVVGLPFRFEGNHRRRVAAAALAALEEAADAVVLVPAPGAGPGEQRLSEALAALDDGHHRAVSAVIDLALSEGLVNLDFADLRSALAGAGRALVVEGAGAGPDRAERAVAELAAAAALDPGALGAARRVLVSLVGGPDLRLRDVEAAVGGVQALCPEDVQLQFGAALRDELVGQVRITVIAGDLPASGVRQLSLPALAVGASALDVRGPGLELRGPARAAPPPQTAAVSVPEPELALVKRASPARGRRVAG